MSLGVDFCIIDHQGNIIDGRLRVGGTYDSCCLRDLNFLHRELFRYFGDVKRNAVKGNAKYAIPHFLPEYMFDLETKEMMTNSLW